MKRKLRLVVFICCSLILLLIFATLLLPSQGEVVRATTIYAPDSIVLQNLTDLQSYPHWFPWIAESQNDIIYFGNDSKNFSGFSFRGQRKDAGLGRYEMGENEGDSLLYYTLHFKDMPEFYGAYLLKENEGKTILVWKMKMDAGWKPWWRFYAAMMHKMTRPVLDSGLAAFKNICENPGKER